METIKFDFNGRRATVIRPDHPNGKWIWKTEFLTAFDQAERALLDMGYTRVYYRISDKYGSYRAVRLMHDFYHFIVKEYDLDPKCILFGFSRGGLYAFNFALFYPEYVDKIYLDAPVLDMRTWPPKGTLEREQVYQEYTLNEDTLERFSGHPIENMKEFFDLNIPLLVIAGGADEVVPFEQNAGRMIEYCKENGIAITSIVKPECQHHPHSLEDVTPIIEFVEGKDMNIFEKSKWIWLSDGQSPDSYVEFFDSFEANGKQTVIRLSCDSDYTLWINGRYVSSNQYGDFEHYKIYDTLDITPYLTRGKNDIKILVHYWGVNTSRYRVARAGLIYEVASGDTVLAVSSEKTRSRPSPVYAQGKQIMVSEQLGFTFSYDATKERTGDEPTLSAVVEKDCTFYPRPIAKAVLRDRIPMTSCKKIDDCHYLVDLGREVVGLPVLELSSKTEQAVTVAWGEHILDGSVRMLLGRRHFHYEYTAKIGKNHFTEYMLRLGCRYIEVFAKEPIELTYAGVLPQCYETQTLPVLIEDELDRRIYDTCVNTLNLCMMEHYVDCPWREQCLYAFDSRNQMLCGYYAFEGGNATYARANLRLIGMDRRPDRLLSICAPCGVSLAIPSFSLHYITEMREYIDHTGDTTLAVELFDKMQGILEEFLDNRENGLIKKFTTPGMWNFYDWSPFMSGRLGKSEAPIPDLGVNALFVIALDHFRAICERVGRAFPYATERDAIREGIRREFLCENGVFTMHKEQEHYSALANALAVLAGAVTGEQAEHICDRIVSDESLADCSLSMKVMEYEALLGTNAEKYKDFVLSDLRKNYKYMLDAGADTFWETLEGADAFGKAGSLCHGWSAVPIYIFHRLGIAKYMKKG